jgi:hypothetical protein
MVGQKLALEKITAAAGAEEPNADRDRTGSFRAGDRAAQVRVSDLRKRSGSLISPAGARCSVAGFRGRSPGD